MKLIAFYLPQFHEIKENNDAWGKGFTEWVNVKKAKKLFLGHYQPRKPLNENYYNLLDDNVLIGQTEIARKYGVYGFCFYHYWFKGKKLLEKPLENMLNNPNMNFPFCLAWANSAWTKTWHGAGGEKEILMRQSYGKKEDWVAHFEYLNTFFRHGSYIKVDNKPMLLIYRVKDIKNREEMFAVWNECAIREGYSGIHLVKMDSYKESVPSDYIEATVEYQPGKTLIQKGDGSLIRFLWSQFRAQILQMPAIPKTIKKIFTVPNKYKYDKVVENSLRHKHSSNQYRGVFVDYDDSPRKGTGATIVLGSTPMKFHNYLVRVMQKSRKEGSEYIFINAWNEWGEGCYLEPDEKWGYQYLEAVKKAVDYVH